jgi:energy-coupling factor transporter ATP-binding protein EcfA2
MNNYPIFLADEIDAILEPKDLIVITEFKNSKNKTPQVVPTKFAVYGPIGKVIASGQLLIFFSPGVRRRIPSLISPIEANSIGDRDNDFLSMLPDIDSYRRIVEKNGKEEAIKILTSMNDIVAFKYILGGTTYLTEVDNFLKTNNSYFAYRRAHTVFEDHSADLDASSNFNLQFKLQKFSNSHKIAFQFGNSDLFSNRIALLIGKNGVGKSRALRSLLSALYRSIEGSSTPTAFLTPRPEISRVLAFSTSTGESVLPLKLNARSGLSYRYFSLLPNLRLEAKNRELIMGMLDIFNATTTIAGEDRSKLLMESCDELFKFSSVAIKLKPESRDSKNIVTVGELLDSSVKERLDLLSKIDFKSRISISRDGALRGLSSGEATFLLFAVHAIANLDASSIVLIDEPENHMHPNLISMFMILLEKLLDLTKSIAIVATHSPFLVRELQSSQVHILQAVAPEIDNESAELNLDQPKARIRISTPRLQTLGASVDSISNYVFGDGTSNKLYQRILSSSSFRGKHGKEALDFLSKYISELSPEAMAFVRSKVMK